MLILNSGTELGFRDKQVQEKRTPTGSWCKTPSPSKQKGFLLLLLLHVRTHTHTHTHTHNWTSKGCAQEHVLTFALTLALTFALTFMCTHAVRGINTRTLLRQKHLHRRPGRWRRAKQWRKRFALTGPTCPLPEFVCEQMYENTCVHAFSQSGARMRKCAHSNCRAQIEGMVPPVCARVLQPGSNTRRCQWKVVTFRPPTLRLQTCPL